MNQCAIMIMVGILALLFSVTCGDQTNSEKPPSPPQKKLRETASSSPRAATKSPPDSSLQKINEELKEKSATELLAETLYGECAVNRDFCLESVAWVIINRQTIKTPGNAFYRKNYKTIVLAKSQFIGLTGTNKGEGRGRSPDRRSVKWRKSWAIAQWMVQFQGNTIKLASAITNKIGSRRYFLDSAYFAKKSENSYLRPIAMGNNTFYYRRDEANARIQ